MTFETHSTFPSSGESATTGLRSMMPPDLSRTQSQRLVFPEREPRPQESPPIRWNRVFPSL
jgi:hypothetical protein